MGRSGQALLVFVAVGCVLVPGACAAQGLTGALIGTVRDDQGGALPGASARLSSRALIGGPLQMTTNERGRLRFPIEDSTGALTAREVELEEGEHHNGDDEDVDEEG